MRKRQYNNSIFTHGNYIVSVQMNGYTPGGKNRYRVGIINTADTHYPHEIVYTTTSWNNEAEEAAATLEYYKSQIKV